MEAEIQTDADTCPHPVSGPYVTNLEQALLHSGSPVARAYRQADAPLQLGRVRDLFPLPRLPSTSSYSGDVMLVAASQL